VVLKGLRKEYNELVNKIGLKKNILKVVKQGLSFEGFKGKNIAERIIPVEMFSQ
jgi:hypothetical protein